MQMEAVNKATMDAMMERKNAFAAAAGRPKPAHQLDKENTSLLTNVVPTGDGDHSCTRKPRKKKTFCLNCKMMVIHKPELCYKLEANKAVRYPGWTSISKQHMMA